MKIQIQQTAITRRNPLVVALRSTGQFRKRVERNRTKYNRKQKHKNQSTD